MTSRTPFGRRVLAILLAVAGAGCGTESPVGTAITDLTFEGRSHNTVWIDFTEYHSINGLVPALDVGTFYYIPKTFWGGQALGPGFALGIIANVREPSFRLIGETPADSIQSIEAVITASKAIGTVERKAQAAVEIAVSLAGIDARLSQSKVTDADRLTLGNLRTATQANLATAERELRDAQAAAEEALMKPGLLVARWTAKRDVKGSVTAGSLAEFSGGQSRGQSGYLIAGGLRVVYLFFGDDYGKALASVGEYHGAGMSSVSVTTHLLQAKNFVYVASLDIDAYAQLLLEAEGKKLFGNPKALLNDIDTVRIGAYLAASSRLRNQRVIGGFTWRKQVLDFTKLSTLSQVNDEGDMERDAHDWSTINVIFARAPWLNHFLAEASKATK
jgi:hypothetical protein